MTARVIATVATARDHLDRDRVRPNRYHERRGHDHLPRRHFRRPIIRLRQATATKRCCASSTRRLPEPTSICSPAICCCSTASASRPSRRIAPSTAQRYAFALRPAGMAQSQAALIEHRRPEGRRLLHGVRDARRRPRPEPPHRQRSSRSPGQRQGATARRACRRRCRQDRSARRRRDRRAVRRCGLSVGHGLSGRGAAQRRD